MAEFLEERLPDGVRIGAQVRDAYDVQITRTVNGSEYRRLNHPYPMRSFVINFTSLRDGVFRSVMDLYDRAHGRYAGFRVKWLDDYTTRSDGRSVPTALDQTLTRISSGVYQLRKAYGSSGTPGASGLPERIIYKPVSGTVVVAKNGVTVGSGVSVDTATGRVTITPAPLITDTITGGCEFDLPCRFDSDIDTNLPTHTVREIGSISVVELLTP